MSQEKPKIIRPIHWSNLRPDEATREILRRLQIASPFVSPHAFDRMTEREEAGRLNTVDMMKILMTGTITQPPRLEEGGWLVVVEKRLVGCREAGIVTLIVHPGDELEVWTVEWMDWL